jgi:hypothetical protein
MKTIAFALVVSATFSSLRASAQQEAIPFFTGGSAVGYADNGAGYAFTPVDPMVVTALGFGGANLAQYPFQVSLYSSLGTQLASATITTGSTFYNQTYYETVLPVILTPGSTYYLGAEAPGAGNIWLGNVIGPTGGSFTVNPYINYVTADVGFMSPGTVPGTPSGGAGYFFVDENFQFTTVVPEPSILGLVAAGGGLMLALWRGALASHFGL